MKEETVWRILLQRRPQSPPRAMGERLMISHRKRDKLGTRPGIQADGAWDDADLRDRAYLEKTGGVAKRG